MKRFKKLMSLLLVLVCLLGAAAGEQGEQNSERILLMTVDGVEVWFEDISNIAKQLYTYGYTNTMDDYIQALNYWLMSSVAAEVLAAPRAEELLGETYEELKAQYEEEFDYYISEYAESLYEEGDSDEAKAEKYQQALQEYASAGLERDSYTYRCLALDAMEMLLLDVIPDVEEEDIQELFKTYVEVDKGYFEGQVAMYEMYTMMYGYTSYYIPEGYRSVLHILLQPDDALINAYKDASEDEKEAARQALLDAVKDQLDEIYAALEDGARFEDLIVEYNEDPGMKNEQTLREGYPVHRDSLVYAQDFTDGAFSEGMDKPGDVSSPIVSEFGVHVMYYLKDIPEGAVELTDEIREELVSELQARARQDYLIEALKQCEIVYTDEYGKFITEANILQQ